MTGEYDGVRGFFRLMGEAIVFLAKDAKDTSRRIWSIVTGSAPNRDAACQMKNCDRQSVTTIPSHERFRDEIEICRRHWLTIRIALVAIAIVAISVVLGSVFVMASQLA